MKSLLILILTTALVGCGFGTKQPVKDPEVVVKYKYVVTTVPDEMFKVPSRIADLDVNTATDKEAADWIVKTYNRCDVIETKLGSVKQYLEDKNKSLKIPQEDLIKN